MRAFVKVILRQVDAGVGVLHALLVLQKLVVVLLLAILKVVLVH